MGFRDKALVLGLAFLLFPPLPSPGGQRSAQIPELADFLPVKSETGGWRADGPPQEFKGDDLFLYIDGGAEIYREYGFARVLVQEYKNGAGRRLSLEIFQMEGPGSAYGMFTYKRGSRGRPVDAGTEGELEDYYLNFWKGPYVVTVTADGENPDGLQELVDLARAVSARIKAESPPPSFVAELPEAGLIPRSVRYLRGYLGFMNAYSSLGKEAFRFQEAVRGDYSSGASLFVLKCASEEESAKTYSEVEKAIAADARSGGFLSKGALGFRLLDDRRNVLSIQLEMNYLLICVEPPGGQEAQRLFGLIYRRLNNANSGRPRPAAPFE